LGEIFFYSRISHDMSPKTVSQTSETLLTEQLLTPLLLRDLHESSGTLPIGQVMIELHLMDDVHVDFERFGKWWEWEASGMRPTWLEINLLAVTLGKGKTGPRCMDMFGLMLRMIKAS
jgi:hypothetical protein